MSTPRDDSGPCVCARLTCDVCGETVATGPPATTEVIAAYKLGRTREGLAHFETCAGALALSFIPAGRN
jgi:hypothetical protein